MNGPRLTIDASRFRRRLQRQVRSLKGGEARRALRAAARQDVLPSVEKESPVVTGAMRGSWIVRNVNPASLPKGVYAVEITNDGKTVYMVRNRKGVMKRKTDRGIRSIRAKTAAQRELLIREQRLLDMATPEERRKIDRRVMRLAERVRLLERQVRQMVRRAPHTYARKVNRSKKSFGFFDRAIRRASSKYYESVKAEVRKVIQ